MKDAPRIRRSQALSPFGVGAILDVLGESLVACSINEWRGRPQLLDAPRPARHLKVDQLRMPPAAPEQSDEGPGVPYYRFPQWMFCPSPKCRRMDRWSLTRERQLSPGEKPRCRYCASKSQLVPMRFVVVCGDGHLDDVDWAYWAHSGPKGNRTCRINDQLRFDVEKGVGGGLQSLSVHCLACKAQRSLHGIASPTALTQLGRRCRGRQPWLPPAQSESCDEEPVIVQRGASNVHFADIASFLDIPPESDFDQWSGPVLRIKADPSFAALVAAPQHPLKDGMIDVIAHNADVSQDLVRQALKDELGDSENTGSGTDFSPEQIRRDEWTAFTTLRDRKADPRDRFVTSHADLSMRTRGDATGPAADQLVTALDALVLAHRLREVRVLRGFRRFTLKRLVPADLGANLPWLPAVEVYGEGVFLSLNEERVAEWEARRDVIDTVSTLASRRHNSLFSSFLPEATPRFVLLHTLAHLLIRQLAHDSGYSGSSIRERIYCGAAGDFSPMAGMLLYTGAGDSEGTLGGLVRSGEPDWFIPSFLSALRGADWCSLDPVCAESNAQGPDGLCLAACHACSLVAETSCESNNLLLDRSLLVHPDRGFFTDVLAADTSERVAGSV